MTTATDATRDWADHCGRTALRFPHVPPEQHRCLTHGDELVYAHNWRRTYACGCTNYPYDGRTLCPTP